MPAPVFIQEAETAWATSTSPKVTASFDVVAGDVLVALGLATDADASISTPVGGSLTWTLQQELNSAFFSHVYLWTAVVDSNKSMTVTFTKTGDVGEQFGGSVLTFRGGAGGVGASAKTSSASGAPALALITTTANSAVVVLNGDWNGADGASRVWRPAGVAFVETTYNFGGFSTVYGGYYPNIGAAGLYTVGLTAPATQKYAIAAVELTGTAATLDQFGFRARNDDGSETSATWKAAQNTAFTVVPDEPFRLRVGVNVVGDAPRKRFKLQYRKVGDASWRDIDQVG
jgi:hypothetical protein